MKFKLFLLPLLCLLFLKSYSQPKEVITIKAGESFHHLTNRFYSYPGFVNGTVFFRDGNNYPAQVNYNLLLAEVQFIDNKGDTLSIANEKDIKSILIGSDTFFYNSEYFQIIAGGPKVKLAASTRFKISDIQKIGAFGLPSVGGSITSYRTLFGKSSPINLVVNEDISFSKTIRFAIVDINNRVSTFTKKNVLKLFPNSSAEIVEYIDTNNINFNDEESLKSLVGYLTSIL